MDRVAAVLVGHGWNVDRVATTLPSTAVAQVRAAIAAGSEVVFACGGDGTVHDVLQGVVDAGDDRPVLGVIPMGSANALARHLGLSMNPVVAARQQMAFVPRAIPLGRIECGGRHRYFTVMAGAGPDGMLVYRMMSAHKGRMGRFAYYVRAATLFVTRRFPAFNVEYVAYGSIERRTIPAVSAMAVRVGELGGLFSRLVGRGEVHHPHLRLTVVRPPGWISLPVWFATGWLRLARWNGLVEVVDVAEFRCTPVGARRVDVEADGEWIGAAPMHVTLMQDAVQLLMPSS